MIGQCCCHTQEPSPVVMALRLIAVLVIGGCRRRLGAWLVPGADGGYAGDATRGGWSSRLSVEDKRKAASRAEAPQAVFVATTVAVFEPCPRARTKPAMAILVCRPRLHWMPGSTALDARTVFRAEGIELGAVQYRAEKARLHRGVRIIVLLASTQTGPKGPQLPGSRRRGQRGLVQRRREKSRI